MSVVLSSLSVAVLVSVFAHCRCCNVDPYNVSWSGFHRWNPGFGFLNTCGL